MIIDGKLVISKKPKKALIEELKEKNFKSFSKASEAAKGGETESFTEDEDGGDNESENTDARADGYDYLLGVSSPI